MKSHATVTVEPDAPEAPQFPMSPEEFEALRGRADQFSLNSGSRT